MPRRMKPSSVRVRLLLVEDSKDLLAAEPTTVPRSAALASLKVESMLTALTLVYENCSIDCSRSSARCTRTTEACSQQTPDPKQRERCSITLVNFICCMRVLAVKCCSNRHKGTILEKWGDHYRNRFKSRTRTGNSAGQMEVPYPTQRKTSASAR